MKKLIMTTSLALAFSAVFAQSDGYIVKTKNVKRVEASAVTAEGDAVNDSEKPRDFISSNFPYYSLCDWKEDMKFMVLPEKYDMVVKTFHDANTGKEVSSMSLRHKIMLYKGHTVNSDGRHHINFLCADNNKPYYYEVPSGSFDDYCYGKMGVPTLAYLGDVDIAKQLLMGKVLFTNTTVYRIDTEAESDKFETVKVDLKKEVKVVDIGVGTRSFPVKIIVEDADGNEFYQNVAISHTNSGMREDEFLLIDNARYNFAGSFEMQDDIMAVSGDIKNYIGEIIHTKVRIPMQTRGDGKERTLTIPPQTTFKLEAATQHPDKDYVTLTLEQTDTRRVYYKDVLFKNISPTAEAANVKLDDYFGYIFSMGNGKEVETSQAARAAIREGRIVVGMTEDEVKLAIGEDPEKIESKPNGQDWSFRRSKGLLVVHFGRRGLVESYTTPGEAKKAQTQGSTRRATNRRAVRSRGTTISGRVVGLE